MAHQGTNFGTTGMIREATIDDIPALVAMGKEFFDLTGLPIEYDGNSVAQMITNLIKNEDAVVLVDDEVKSAIAGLVYPFYFNTDILSGNEMFWWVSPEKRGTGLRLVDKLEDWARDKGADLFQMTCLHEGHEKIGRYYERRGYMPTEHNYMRAL